MAYHITIKDKTEFKLDNNKISDAVIKAIIDNLKNTKPRINVLVVRVMEDKMAYNLSIERQYFLDILKKNLIFKEKKEDYLACAKIRDAINYITK